MSDANFQSQLFDAYQKSTSDLAPPGFVLRGNRILQTIGSIDRLFSTELPSELDKIEQLPDGEIKDQLFRIGLAIEGLPPSSSGPNQFRVSSVGGNDPELKNCLLAVFDPSSDDTQEKHPFKEANPNVIDLLEDEHDLHDPFCDRRIGQLETPRVILWQMDPNGSATYISKEESLFVGCAQSELLGLGWLDGLHPDDVAESVLTFRQAVEREEPFCFNSRRRRFDGKYFWFKTHGIPSFDDAGELVGYQGFCLECTQQLEMQSALFANQRVLRSVLDNSPLMSAFVDRDLRYRYINNKYAEFWNLSNDEIVGHTIPELLGDSFGSLQPFLERALFGETVFHEMTIPNELSGESKWLEVTHVPAFDSDESVVGFYCFINDVTESKKHERLLKMVLSNTPAMVFLLDAQLNVRHTNLQFVSRLIAPGTVVTDSHLNQVICQKSFLAFEEHLNNALLGKKCSSEAILTASNGESIDAFLNFVPELNSEGRVIGVCGWVLDISELKQTQDELKRTEARFELAVSGSSLGIIELDPDRPDWIFADHVESLLGFEQGELQNSRAKIRELIHPDDFDENQNANAISNRGQDSKFELRLRNKAGQYRWFDVFSQKTNNPDGEPGRFVGTIVDIDDLKTAQLESAAQVCRRDEFLAMLSHELRNPMAAIVMSLEMLKESNIVSAELKSVVEMMMRQSNQISRLLDDLLDVSRVTHNRIQFKQEVHDVNHSIDEVVCSFRSWMKHQNRVLHVELADSPMMIEGDESRIKQVVTNLLENAIRYSENDSQIWLSTSVVDSQVKISVRDEGIGIPPDLIGNIFDLFCQGESTIHRSSGGMGVGLFLVKHIVDAHDGDIDVHSAGTGLGSRFDIRIPQSTKSMETAPTVLTPDFELLSIVIVEDNSDARKMTSQLLELQGFEVIQFSDGESACQEIPILCPDVAIIDIGLPGKSGLDLAREFRKNKNLENTILVALTGYGRESDQQETTAAGFDLHFVKPTSIEDLTHAIGTWAQKNRNDLPLKTFRPNRKGMPEMSATASSLLKSDQQG